MPHATIAATPTRSGVSGVSGAADGPSAGPDAVLRLHVRGFTAMELRLLEGTVKLSQRRPPRIDLVDEADADSADVVMVDANHSAAVQWATSQPWLAARPVIWAGAKSAPAGHVVIDRHVKWPILPVLLYRALEQNPLRPQQQAVGLPAGDAPNLNRKVLVVDDSMAARAYLRTLLERLGVDVVEAASAEAAIEVARQQSCACVFMDVLMPGIDGFEACRRIRGAARAGSAPPVVMLTSKSSPFDRVRGKMAGCDTYLTKPVDPRLLHEVVARHVAAAVPPPAARAPGQADPAPPGGATGLHLRTT